MIEAQQVVSSLAAMKQAVEAMRFELKIDWTDPDESLLAADKLRDAIISLEKAIEQAEKQERNFCPRCGKRTNDIHTCTPSQLKREWVGLKDEEVKHEWEIWRANVPRYAGFAKGIEAKLKEKNT